MKTIYLLFENQKKFSAMTFGRYYRVHAVIKHMRKELDELAAKPNDIMEFADMFLLLLDALWRQGFSINQLLAAAYEKLHVNRKRKWKKPDKGGVIEHAR